jgi:hypothetical protein
MSYAPVESKVYALETGEKKGECQLAMKAVFRGTGQLVAEWQPGVAGHRTTHTIVCDGDHFSRFQFCKARRETKRIFGNDSVERSATVSVALGDPETLGTRGTQEPSGIVIQLWIGFRLDHLKTRCGDRETYIQVLISRIFDIC